MKKALSIIYIFIAFLVIYFLQSNFFDWFNISGIKPNLFIIIVLFLGLFLGRNIGIAFGLLFGMLLDLFLGQTVGISSIMLGLVGFLGGVFDKNFSKDSRITVMFMVFGATAIYEFGMYLLRGLIININIEIITFAKILGIEAIFNILIVIILYPLFQRIGYRLEEIFKGNKILTRYF